MSQPFHSRRRFLYPYGPMVSAVGFGGYRLGFASHQKYPGTKEALRHALLRGVNLLDTSANYGFGDSETIMGQVLNELFTEKALSREDVVVVSKGGYIQGPLLESITKNPETAPPFIRFGEDLGYSLHPDFIAQQLEASLKRLNLKSLDVYLLHNPEYILKSFEMESRPRPHAVELFEQALRAAFQVLEDAVQAGRIQAYGISSNTLGAPEEEYTSVSVKRCLELAQDVTPNHHFRVLQFPMNWLEVSPLFYQMESTQQTLLQFARQHGLGCLINRPFNAMLNERLLRLTRPTVAVEQLKNEREKQGYENWMRLATDLERLTKDQLQADVPGYEDAPLSQLVLATLAWVPGVSSVLCGLRETRYVDDAEQALSRPMLLKSSAYLRDIYENLEFHESE